MKKIALSWINTPELIGNREKGGGVDCINLVVAIFDEKYKKNTPVIESGKTTNRNTAIQALKKIKINYKIKKEKYINLGTVLVFRNNTSYHFAMAINKNECISTNKKVKISPISMGKIKLKLNVIPY